MNTNNNPLIHVARIQIKGEVHYLILRRLANQLYQWFEETHDLDIPTSVEAPSIREAIRLSRRFWSRDEAFRMVGCGFRYTLPERDEHGENALFYQMAASLSTVNGFYLDAELGCMCYVSNPSTEARNLWHRFTRQGKL
ncbi:MAG: hypothetical protein Tsb0021_11070 [Chlamydiales bacterium]